MKERVELEIATMEAAIESLGYLHIDEEKGKQLIEFFKELYAENQALKADREKTLETLKLARDLKDNIHKHKEGSVRQWAIQVGKMAEAALQSEGE